MRKITYTLLSVSLFTLMSLSLWAGGETETVPQDNSVIATTSWTAAVALLAGVENPTILAPFEMQHPSEYELTPSDIQLISEAKVIVFAGYEVMVTRIKDTIGTQETELIPIKTVNNYEEISLSVMKIAQVTRSEEAAWDNLMRLKELFNETEQILTAQGVYGKRAIVHFHQVALAKELGFQVVGTFGPQPLEPKKLGELSQVECDLIIDNWHNPVGQSLEEITGADYVSLINFPGKEGTVTIYDVIEYNRDQLTSPN